MILDTKFLDELTEKAKESPRLRMNYTLHDSLESKAQRLFNGLEPGTVLPIHRHADTSESYILIRGSLRVTLLDDNKNVTESVELNLDRGVFGFQIPANTWHKVEVLESGTVIFEVKDGPYTPLTNENIMER